MNNNPITFKFTEVDAATREAFERYCEVRLAEQRAVQEQERTKQRAQDQQHEEAMAHQHRQSEADEPKRVVERAKADAEAEKIRLQASCERAKVEHEIRKLQIEGDRLESEAKLDVVTKAADLLWPKIESFGRGIVGLAREENKEIRDILIANMHLLAGRNPQDGTK